MTDEIDNEKLDLKSCKLLSQETGVLQLTLHHLASTKPKKTWVRLDRGKIKTTAIAVADALAADLISGSDTADKEWEEQIRKTLREAAAKLQVDEQFDTSAKVLERNGQIKFTERGGRTYYRPRYG